mmetsp:Transcript_2958/g.7550  ORF Transcript_2958/g.7550 Transcript_2958/m.7550 type:complete len:138 (-) Transcript_2958:30-443(-)
MSDADRNVTSVVARKAKPLAHGAALTVASASKAKVNVHDANGARKTQAPDSPIHMNGTEMNVKTLPDRHINGQTMSSDWRKEYPVFGPENVTRNATGNVTDNVTGAQAEEGSARHPFGAVTRLVAFALALAVLRDGA